jgi:hypothetical protein
MGLSLYHQSPQNTNVIQQLPEIHVQTALDHSEQVPISDQSHLLQGAAAHHANTAQFPIHAPTQTSRHGYDSAAIHQWLDDIASSATPNNIYNHFNGTQSSIPVSAQCIHTPDGPSGPHGTGYRQYPILGRSDFMGPRPLQRVNDLSGAFHNMGHDFTGAPAGGPLNQGNSPFTPAHNDAISLDHPNSSGQEATGRIQSQSEVQAVTSSFTTGI